jgi:hypothetical protein
MPPTSNQGRSIVTKGTSDQAVATTPDVCLVPGQPAPVPSSNHVESSMLGAGATTMTFIDGAPVWTSAGQLGPPSEPAHAGTGGGMCSGTYRSVATPTSYSKDVIMEGGGVVRLFDSTLQNRGNAVGVVLAAGNLALPEGKVTSAPATGEELVFLPPECAYLAECSSDSNPPAARLDAMRGPSTCELYQPPPESQKGMFGHHEASEPTFDYEYPSKWYEGDGSIDHPAHFDTIPMRSNRYIATVGGKKIPIIAPEWAPDLWNAADPPLPSPDEVARALATVPEPLLRHLDTVVISPLANPQDWVQARNKNTPGFRSSAATTYGLTYIYPKPNQSQERVDRRMLHECGHQLYLDLDDKRRRLGQPRMDDMWGAVAAADGRAPSAYARSDAKEDFAESCVMYFASKGTPCEEYARRLYPNRCQMLDQILADDEAAQEAAAQKKPPTGK